jgi:CBS domain-containing protein
VLLTDRWAGSFVVRQPLAPAFVARLVAGACADLAANDPLRVVLEEWSLAADCGPPPLAENDPFDPFVRQVLACNELGRRIDPLLAALRRNIDLELREARSAAGQERLAALRRRALGNLLPAETDGTPRFSFGRVLATATFAATPSGSETWAEFLERVERAGGSIPSRWRAVTGNGQSASFAFATDADCNFGSSGGPVVDRDGLLLGIVTHADLVAEVYDPAAATGVLAIHLVTQVLRRAFHAFALVDEINGVP